MAILAFLMLGSGALGLTIESTTPDAHCPPTTEVQEAVAARVGDVQGQEYSVEYGLVRNADAGTNSVVLVLRDSESVELLRREIPVADDSCSDVALAIAIVLERYFAGVIGGSGSDLGQFPEATREAAQPTSGAAASDEDPQNEPSSGAQPQSPSSDAAEAGESSGDEGSEAVDSRDSSTIFEGRHFVRGAIGVGRGPQPVFHLGVGRRFSSWGAISAELSSWPLPTETDGDDPAVKTSWWGLHLGPELSVHVTPDAHFSVAQYVGVALVQARIDAAVAFQSEGPTSKAVPTVGAALRFGFDVGERLMLGVSLHGVGLLGSYSYVVEDPAAGGTREVFSLPVGRSDASLYAAYRF